MRVYFNFYTSNKAYNLENMINKEFYNQYFNN